MYYVLDVVESSYCIKLSEYLSSNSKEEESTTHCQQ